MISLLEMYDITTGNRTVLKEFDNHMEAPNWMPDGNSLIYNAGGQICRYDLATGESIHIPTGSCTSCNNDHVVSADGKNLAISSGTGDNPVSRVWVLPITGGEPRLVTEKQPSYLHGWSPDGKALAYCADRDGNYDVYTISVEGGAEARLTTAPGLDDGPEFSPDGKHIWFNSVRSGLMQAWRMNADGSNQTRMTHDDSMNVWFPHVSPDGQKVVTVCYYKGDVAPGDHPPLKNIEVRMMDADGQNSVTLFKAFGGQGTMNVNSWSPDSQKFAFVTYRV